MEEGKGRGGALAALLAAGALGIAAVPAYGALNPEAGGSGTATEQESATPGFVQDEQAPEQQRPGGERQRDEDCPWKDGGGRGSAPEGGNGTGSAPAPDSGGSGGNGSAPQEGVSFDSASTY